MPRREKLFGRDLGIVFEAVRTGRKVKAGAKFWSALARSPDLFEMVYRRVMAEVSFQAKRPAYDVTVDYGLTWASLLQAARCHAQDFWLHWNKVPVLDPARGKEQIMVELLWFYGGANRGQIYEAMNKLPSYRFATLAETVALLAAHPDAIWDRCEKTVLAPEYLLSPREVPQKKQLLILGDLEGHKFRSAPMVHLADSVDPHWVETWFGLRDDASDVNMQWNCFIPVVRLS